MKHRFFAWLVHWLPPIFSYHGAIRVFACATTGPWSSQIVPELNAMEALKRFSDFHGVK